MADPDFIPDSPDFIPDELMGGSSEIQNTAQSQDEAILGPLKNLLSGSMRGSAQLAGLAGDAITYLPRKAVEYIGGKPIPSMSSMMDKDLNTLGLPREDSLAQRIGEYLVPVGPIGKGLQMTSGLAQGVMDYGSEKMLPDSPIARASLTIGAGLTPGAIARGISKTAPKAAGALERGALGITKAQIKQSQKSLPKTIEGAKMASPLEQSVEAVRQEGGLSQMVKDPEGALEAGRQTVADLSDELETVLKEADTATTTKIYPRFENAQKYIDSLTGTEKVAAAKELATEKKLLLTGKSKELDGSLASIQKAKKKWNSKSYTPTNLGRKSLDKAITADLKTAIEKAVDDLASQGKISEDLQGRVKALNKRMGNYSQLEPILESGKASGKVDALNKLIPKLATTGGLLAAPSAIGYYNEDPKSGFLAGLALTLMNTGRGKLGTAKALRGASSLTKDASRTPDIAKALAAYLANQESE